ncbi:MAG: ribosome maturation factor RimP [Alphaproteobacteria bacterium]|nr:ribosome maturation factor RimP [Alphaproteobacteria bacterium]
MSDFLDDKVAEIIRPSVSAMGYDVVRANLSGNRRRTLQIMVERIDRAEMNVEDCAKVSRAVSALLDVEDPISEAYDLEVSSPGIDRPLVRLSDFQRFSGFEARIELKDLVDGRKRLRGTLLGVGDDEIVTIDSKGDGISVPYSEIKAAKLVLTDELIEASLAGKL